MGIVLASNNQGKLREIKALLTPLGVAVRTATQMGFSGEVNETGSSFTENAALKACAVAEALGVPALADDSGLSVDHLGGAPGVYSARYSGLQATSAENNAKLLSEMQGIPRERRGCAFICVMCLCTPHGRSLFTTGRWGGEVALEPDGEEGFGYDPVFYLPEAGLTVARLTPDEKNAQSHRSQALHRMVQKLPAFLRTEGD